MPGVVGLSFPDLQRFLVCGGGGNLGPRPRNFKGKVEIEATAQRHLAAA